MGSMLYATTPNRTCYLNLTLHTTPLLKYHHHHKLVLVNFCAEAGVDFRSGFRVQARVQSELDNFAGVQECNGGTTTCDGY